MGREIVVRGRGPRIFLLRLLGIVVAGASVVGYLHGTAHPAAATVVVVLATAWLVLLHRPKVVVSANSVALYRLIATTVLPKSSIEAFDVVRRRRLFDQLERVRCLRVRLDGHDDVLIPWVEWRDYTSPWIVGDRPLPTRARRVLEKLNSTLQ